MSAAVLALNNSCLLPEITSVRGVTQVLGQELLIIKLSLHTEKQVKHLNTKLYALLCASIAQLWFFILK